MESGVRGMAQVRQIASEIPEGLFFGILDRHKVPSLDQVPSFAVLRQLVEAMNQVRASEKEENCLSQNRVSPQGRDTSRPSSFEVNPWKHRSVPSATDRQPG
jgi:hypothetical protein